MKKIILALLLSSPIVYADSPYPCRVRDMISSLSSGSYSYTMKNDDPATIVWVSTFSVSPTVQAITNAQNTCLGNQTQASAYQIELSTLTTSLQGKTTSYVGSSAVAQIQLNAKMARILELRQLLGLQ